jgi:hypothetical protein
MCNIKHGRLEIIFYSLYTLAMKGIESVAELVMTCVFLLLLVDRLVIDPMIEDCAGIIGEAKSECATAVGLRVCGLSPRADTSGLGSAGGSGGFTII